MLADLGHITHLREIKRREKDGRRRPTRNISRSVGVHQAHARTSRTLGTKTGSVLLSVACEYILGTRSFATPP